MLTWGNLNPLSQNVQTSSTEKISSRPGDDGDG